ncbi:MAG: hypothetical protein BV456_10845 [Thermoplasmata archaeon M8B2D]|nr:MAG: hypothetical protein BV456_10845 [Thermoplasmata archaeon M8B2D]
MGVLDQITDMQGRGLSESQIVNRLREQNISPREINDALGQAQIKNAISSSRNNIDQMEPSMMGSPQSNSGSNGGASSGGGDISNEDLTPPPTYSKIPAAAQRSFGRMTKEVSAADDSADDYVPQPGDQPQYYPQQAYPQSSSSYQPYQEYGYAQQPEGYYPEQNYGYDTEYQPMPQSPGVVDSDTTIEIAEQVFSEKSKEIQKNIDDLTEISTLVQSKIESFSERLKRIESTIDHLQSEILDKVGSYGSNLDSIKKEMSMMQDSFGKVVNSALDHSEHKHHSSNPVHKTTTVIHRSTPKTKKISRKR